MRFDKNFCTSDNQFLIKFLTPDVFDYGDSKSESWHRAKKNREVFMVIKSPRALFSVIENRVCFGRRFETIIKLLENCRGMKIFSKLCWKNALFLHTCLRTFLRIKLVWTPLKMAQQTNFVKLSIIEIRIYSVFDWASLFSYMKYKYKVKLGPRPINAVYISELPFAMKLKT